MLASDKVKLELRNANRMKCVMRYYNEKKYNLWNSYENQELRYQKQNSQIYYGFLQIGFNFNKMVNFIIIINFCYSKRQI